MSEIAQALRRAETKLDSWCINILGTPREEVSNARLMEWAANEIDRLEHERDEAREAARKLWRGWPTIEGRKFIEPAKEWPWLEDNVLETGDLTK